MILELLIALLCGVTAGTLTGITPGIHINMVSSLLIFISTLSFFSVEPIVLVVFIVSMSVTHTFIDYIPSIFLGAPDDTNFLSILPGHELLIKGKGYSAVVYTLYGSLMGIFIIILLSPIFLIFLPKFYEYAQRIMPIILLVTIFFLLFFEKKQRYWAIMIFILSGFLGIAAYNLPLKEPLLPMFTGLFGVSSLITSLTKKQTIPPQEIIPLKKIKLKRKSFLRAIFASLIASPLCSFLPGLGSGQAAVIGSQVVNELDRREFLVLLGAVNMIVLGLSFITLYSINKYRTGVAAAVAKIISLSLSDVTIILIVIVFSGLLAFFISIIIAKYFSRIISKVNYSYLSGAVIALLLALVFIFSGFLGFLLCFVSTFLGLTCILLGIRRTHLMGCLLIPVLLFYI